MNKKLLDALKGCGCSIETGKTLKAESAAGMDEKEEYFNYKIKNQ